MPDPRDTSPRPNNPLGPPLRQTEEERRRSGGDQNPSPTSDPAPQPNTDPDRLRLEEAQADAGVGGGTTGTEKPGPHLTEPRPQQGVSSSELSSGGPDVKQRATEEAKGKPDNTSP